jgi:hypothetical protein
MASLHARLRQLLENAATNKRPEPAFDGRYRKSVDGGAATLEPSGAGAPEGENEP